jgi:hypothetical protein
MSEASRLIARARQLGREYMGKYACAEATLLAVAETLNMPVSDDVFKATIGLSSMSGGCGGFCGAIAAIGLRFGRTRATYQENSDATKIGFGKWYRTLREAVVRVRSRFVAKYGGSLCCDIQDKLFGRSFNFLDLDPKDMEAFMQPEKMLTALEVCRKVTENAAGWTVEAILETETTLG